MKYAKISYDLEALNNAKNNTKIIVAKVLKYQLNIMK